MPAQRGDPSVGRRRYNSSQHAVRDCPAVFAHEQIGRDRLRPPAQTCDTFRRAIRQPDQDRRHASEIHQIGLQHPQRDARRHAGIDRVAAALQDRKPSRGREIVAGRNRVPRAKHGRTIGHALCPRLKIRACVKTGPSSRRGRASRDRRPITRGCACRDPSFPPSVRPRSQRSAGGRRGKTRHSNSRTASGIFDA